MKRVSILLTALAVIAPLIVLARITELNVVLKWNPNEKTTMPVLDTTGGLYALAIPDIVDRREKGKQIGENTEEKVAVPIYTSSDVAAFVHEHLLAQLKAIGLEVTAADSGDRILRAEVNDFWVAEKDRYRGTVRLKVAITDSSGKEVWSALVGGASDRFGRSLKPDNYTEGFSNATIDLVAKLVASPGFRSAIARTR